MKFAKWLMIAVCALFCCACSKNNPLAYVDKNAEEIFYLDTTEDLNDDEQELFKTGRSIQKKLFNREVYLGIAREYFDKDKFKFLGINLLDTPAKLAVWCRYDKTGRKAKDVRAVMVLEEDEAADILEDCKDYWEERGDTYIADDVTIDGCDALLLKRESGDDEKLFVTIIADGKKRLQFIFDDEEPDSLLEAENKSELAKKIKSKYIFGGAISADLNEKRESKFGDEVFGVYFSRNEFRSELVSKTSSGE